eukprot:gene19365-biopygen955
MPGSCFSSRLDIAARLCGALPLWCPAPSFELPARRGRAARARPAPRLRAAPAPPRAGAWPAPPDPSVQRVPGIPVTGGSAVSLALVGRW